MDAYLAIGLVLGLLNIGMGLTLRSATAAAVGGAASMWFALRLAGWL